MTRRAGRLAPSPKPRRRARASASSPIPGGPGPSASSATGPDSSRSSSTGSPGCYGRPTWQRRLDPTSELILTILTQNSADTNAEVAFEALRARYPGAGEVEAHNPGAGWGGVGLPDGVAAGLGARSSSRHSPSWSRRSGRAASANQKAPRIQATLRQIREERGDYSLEFLGDMTALEARDWLTADRRHRQEDRVGAAAVLVRDAAHAGRPARRAGRAAGRARSARRPRADDAHDLFLGMLEPDQMYEAHVNLIQHGRKVCHAQRPDHEPARLRARCRFVDPKAP